jgi:serine protease Do
MTRKITVSLVVSLLITGGIALAQQPSTPRTPSEPNEPFGNFSLFIDGGSFLGVQVEEIDKTNMSNYGLREVRGIGITEVSRNSPAEKAGLKKGDVILRFDNESINSARKLTRMVSETAPDHSVKIEISRAGSEQSVSATLTKREEMSNTIFQDSMPGGVLRGTPFPGFPQLEQQGQDGTFFSFGDNRRIGISTQPLTKQLADFFGVADGMGVLVTSVNESSPAAKAGVKAGDVITAIDGDRIESSGDLSRGINKQKDGDVTLTIVRDKGSRTIKVTPEKGQNPPLRSRGTIGSQRVMREQMRDAILQGMAQGRIVIPQINLPAIPAINVTVPRIEVPSIPPIDIVIPATPKVRVVRRVRVVI